MRDPSRTIRLLERKAADTAVTGPERESLLAKAAELRRVYGVSTAPSEPVSVIFLRDGERLSGRGQGADDLAAFVRRAMAEERRIWETRGTR